MCSLTHMSHEPRRTSSAVSQNSRHYSGGPSVADAPRIISWTSTGMMPPRWANAPGRPRMRRTEECGRTGRGTRRVGNGGRLAHCQRCRMSGRAAWTLVSIRKIPGHRALTSGRSLGRACCSAEYLGHASEPNCRHPIALTNAVDAVAQTADTTLPLQVGRRRRCCACTRDCPARFNRPAQLFRHRNGTNSRQACLPLLSSALRPQGHARAARKKKHHE